MEEKEINRRYLKILVDAIGLIEPGTYPTLVLFEEFKKKHPEANYNLFRSMLEVLEEIGAAELGIDEIKLKPGWNEIVNKYLENG